MDKNKKVFAALILLAIMVFGGCQFLGGNTQNNSQQGATFVPLEQIIVEGSGDSKIQGDAVKPAEDKATTELNTSKESQEKPEETTAETPVENQETAPSIENGEATTLIVKETDKVSLKPKGFDPDNDKITYTFTSPLDASGEWQTTYGNGGEYRITVTASDGKLTASKDVLLIVNKKEESPTIDKFSPEEKTLSADENTKIDFSIAASDLNKDRLDFSWKLDGKEKGKGSNYIYDITYDDVGSHTVKADVSDGVSTSTNIWSITVNNVNRNPILGQMPDIKIKETEKAILKPIATDPDKDNIEFTVDSDKFKKTEGNIFGWDTGYDDAGEYTVKVSVSDGTDSVSQNIKVTVENVNRPPVITEVVQTK